MAIINQPSLLPGEFASDGDKNVIPANNDGLSGLASIAKGFPPITQQPLASGGLPPQRADFNGIFNLISQFLLYSQNGGVFTYSATLDYNPPAIVGDGEGNIYMCIAQNGPNTTAGVQAISNTSYWVKVINLSSSFVMSGATQSESGNIGLVPEPSVGEQNKFLRGDGTWAEALEKTDLLDLIYPVGSIYMSVNSTSPDTLFGGTWEAMPAGRVLLAQGESNWGTTYEAGSTGGEATHQLTVGELPSHNHNGTINTANLVGQANNIGIAINNVSSSGIFSHRQGDNNYGNGNSGQGKATLKVNATHTHAITINNTGSSQAHNNIQPYLTVYMWKRTA